MHGRGGAQLCKVGGGEDRDIPKSLKIQA